MYRIPVINQTTVFDDINRQPLVNGKIDVLDPVSNNPLTIWSYSDDEYTVMTNPVILDIEGRVPHTVFCDRIVYCRAYAFKGYDENSHPIYEFTMDFYAGENENSESREYVVGMEALRDLDPSINSSVNVLGYYSSTDCPMRTYIWDSNSTLDPDGIWIVTSDVTSAGRWILNYEGEYLPSRFAGVYPGSESNINALASYVGEINGRKTSPGIYFAPGDYSFATDFATTKKVLLDANTSFACTYFSCDSVTVKGTPSKAIADFIFSSQTQEAHSSWFRTLRVFYSCGAAKYVIDSVDNFTDKAIGTVIELAGKTIVGTTRIPATYTGSGRLRIDGCNIVGERIWNSTDKITFVNTVFRDEWFSNPTSSIDFGNSVLVATNASNYVNLDNFKNVTAYVNAIASRGETRLDLAGRYVSSLTVPSSVNEIINVRCGTMVCSRSGANITMFNVKCDNMSVTANQLNTADCEIDFNSEPSLATVGIFTNSVITGGTWNGIGSYKFSKCNVGVSFRKDTDNVSDRGSLEFNECVIENQYIYAKQLTMNGCTAKGCVIKAYPLQVSGVYTMPVTLLGNVFNSGTAIELTKVADDNCYDVHAVWNICNNTFIGNDKGITCRYWQNRLGSNSDKVFIKRDSDSVILYRGNNGKCPAESCRGYTTTGQPFKTVTYLGNSYNLYSTSISVCPKFDQATSRYNIDEQSESVPAVISGNDVTLPGGWFWYMPGELWDDRNGEFFQLAIAGFNKILGSYGFRAM